MKESQEYHFFGHPHENKRKHRGKESSYGIPAEIRVRCEGKLHTIVWEPRGRVRFLNHSARELRALRTMRALGDTNCGCLNCVERMVRSKATNGGPAWGQWRPVVREAEWVRRMRESVKDERENIAFNTGIYGTRRIGQGKNNDALRRASQLARMMYGINTSIGTNVRFDGKPRPMAFGTSWIRFERQSFTMVGLVSIALTSMWRRVEQLGAHQISVNGKPMLGLDVRNVGDKTAEVLIARIHGDPAAAAPVCSVTVSEQWAAVRDTGIIGKDYNQNEHRIWAFDKWLEE